MFPSLSKQTIEKTNTTRDTFNPQIKACINYEPRDIQGGAEHFCFLTIYYGCVLSTFKWRQVKHRKFLYFDILQTKRRRLPEGEFKGIIVMKLALVKEGGMDLIRRKEWTRGALVLHFR